MKQYQPNVEEIKDEYLDAVLRVVFRLREEEQIRAIMEQTDWEQTEEEKAQARAEWERIVEKYEKMQEDKRKKERGVALRRCVKSFFRVAACALAILAIAAPIAIANVEPLRASVMKLLIDIQEDHTELRLVEIDEPVIEIPEGWTGIYYPTYMPEGFELEKVSELFWEATYRNEEGAAIYFSEYDKGAGVNINSENAKLSYIYIYGEQALVVERPGYVIVTWQLGNRFIVLDADVSREEAVKIAESVRMIE